MRITILTAGSRGDIQPYLALALALKQVGHHVKLATHLNFKEWIESYGIEYAQLGGNPRELGESEEAHQWVEAGRNLVKYVKSFKQAMIPLLTQLLVDCW